MSYSPGDVILYKYRIEKRLNHELYQVTQLSRNARRMLQLVSRTAAKLTEEEFRQLNDEFQSAVRLSAQISHPNLLQVLDSDSNADQLALLMEDAPGGTLADRMAQVPPGTAAYSPGAAAQLGIQIAEGLQALHSRGYVHSDLQPSNLFLDEQGHVKVGGLGKAKIPGYAFDFLTPSGAEVSDYSSPEQKASVRNLSFASDVYSLGCILFGLLSGRVYSKQKPVTRVSALALTGLEWLDALILRMLSPDPRLRPADGAEAARLLRAAGQLEAPPPVSTTPQLSPVELLPNWIEPVQSAVRQIPARLGSIPAKMEKLPAKVEQLASRERAPRRPPPPQKTSTRAPGQGVKVLTGLIVILIFAIFLCLFIYAIR